MNRAALTEMIRNGEGSGIEFKGENVRPEQLAREIVALANFKGGTILLGVEDDGTVSGVSREDMEEWVMDVCATLVHPRLIHYYEEVATEDVKVALVSVDMGVAKPYVVRHNGREDIYIRIGSTSRLATREEQVRLFQSGGILHVEILPVPRATFGTLDIRRLQDYFGRVRKMTALPNDDQEWTDLLVNMEYMTKPDSTPPVCTIAGLVLFGRQPKRYLYQAGLMWSVFAGRDKDYDARDRATLDGPLVGLWDDRGLLQEDGLLDMVMSKVRQHASREGLGDNYLTRKVTWDFSPEAVREAVLNAFAHRDWSRPADIEVSLYENRMEIVSPGALPNHVTVERMKLGLRMPRNPILVQTLRDYGYVEQMGMGVRNKIIRGMLDHNGREPEFLADEMQLTVRLYR